MNRRCFLKSLLGAGAATLAGAGLAFSGEGSPSAGIDGADHLGIDAHCHPHAFFKIKHDSQYWLDEAKRHTLEQMARGGIHIGLITAVGDWFYRDNKNNSKSGYADIMAQLDQVWEWAEKGLIKVVTRFGDLETTSPSRIQGILACEGGNWLEGAMTNLQPAYDYGLRALTIIHGAMSFYAPTLIGSSQRGVPEYGDQGLTDFGKDLIPALNDLGMVVDVAHCSPQSLFDTCALTKKPILDSHTSPFRDWMDHPDDGQRLRGPSEIQAVADTGGVVCLWPLGYGTGEVIYDRTTMADWAGEVAEMMTRFGDQCVGLGTDGCGGLPLLNDYQTPADLPVLKAALVNAGLSQAQIAAFWGGNVLRVLGECLK